MLDRKIKIGFISEVSPFDRTYMSGTNFKICESLSSLGYEIDWIRVRRSKQFLLYSNLIRRINKFRKNKIDVDHTILGSKLLSQAIDITALSKCDVLFTAFGSQYICKLHVEQPIISLTDATFHLMVGYYYTNKLCKWSVKQGNLVEQYAFDTSKAIVVASQWTANSLLKDYHQPLQKVHVVEFGANIDDKDIIKRQFSYNGHLHVLFLGVDWKRKGGQIAVDTCKWLNEHGVSATLHIVGIKDLDESILKLPYIDYIGFLNKNIPEQYAKLVEIIRLCHCLLLPTLKEAAGIAFCEASAYGLPSFSHLTGGTGNYVYDGRNGYLLPLGSTGADFGSKIKQCLESGELERMSITAKEVYKEKLNWHVWANKVEKIINDILKK